MFHKKTKLSGTAQYFSLSDGTANTQANDITKK